MNPKCIYGIREERNTDFGELRAIYDIIKRDIRLIEACSISEDAKKLPLEELNKQINDVKERMHNYIDAL